MGPLGAGSSFCSVRPTSLVWVVFVGGVGGNPRRPPPAPALPGPVSPTSVPLPYLHPPSVGPVPARGPGSSGWHLRSQQPSQPRPTQDGLRWTDGGPLEVGHRARRTAPDQRSLPARPHGCISPEATRGAPTLTLPRPSPGPHPWPQTLSGSPRSSTQGGMASHPPTRHTARPL